MAQSFNSYLLRAIQGGWSTELKEGKGVMGKTQTSETSSFIKASFASLVAVN